MWLEMVSGLQVSLTDRSLISFISSNLTTGRGLSLMSGKTAEILIFRRFVLRSQKVGGKSLLAIRNITVVILDHSLASKLDTITRIIHFPFVTLILTNSPDLWGTCKKRCCLVVSLDFLIEYLTRIGSYRALDGHFIDD